MAVISCSGLDERSEHGGDAQGGVEALGADRPVDLLVQVVDPALLVRQLRPRSAPASIDACMPGSTARSSHSTASVAGDDAVVERGARRRRVRATSRSGRRSATCGGRSASCVMKNRNPRPPNTMLRFGNTWYENVPDSGR